MRYSTTLNMTKYAIKAKGYAKNKNKDLIIIFNYLFVIISLPFITYILLVI